MVYFTVLHAEPRLDFHSLSLRRLLPRILLGLPWSCPTLSESPTFRSSCCLAACLPSRWSAPLARPSGSTSMATMPGTWTSTVRAQTALAEPLIPHIFSHLFISAYFFCHFKFLKAGMCRCCFVSPQLNNVCRYKWNMWQCGNSWVPC